MIDIMVTTYLLKNVGDAGLVQLSNEKWIQVILQGIAGTSVHLNR